MAYPYRFALTEDERAHLRGIVGSGIAPARTLPRARKRPDRVAGRCAGPKNEFRLWLSE